METDAGGRSLFIISCERFIDKHTKLFQYKKNTYESFPVQKEHIGKGYYSNTTTKKRV